MYGQFLISVSGRLVSAFLLPSLLEGFKQKLKANIAKEQVVTGVYFKGKENLLSETDRTV